MTAVSVVQVPPTPVGVARAGPPGKGWVFGEGPPEDNVGRIGEMYLDMDPEGVFNAYGPKLGGTWVGAQVYPLGAQSAGAIAAQEAAEAAADLAGGYAESAADDSTATAADRVQTGQDRTAVAADKVTAVAAKVAAEAAAESSADDAVATAADRVAVEADRTAVADDAADLAAHRAAVDAAADAVSSDATQTAADRVQTGLDRDAAEAAAAAAATFDPGDFYTKTAADGRYATTAQGAKADTAVQPAGLTKSAVGLSNVDNTADVSKPVSTAQQTALNLKQNAADKAAASDILAGSDAGKHVTSASLAGATALSSSTGSGSWAPNFATQGTPRRVANGTSTLAAPTNGIEGRAYVILLVQDGTGSRAWSFATNYDFGAAGAPTASTGANKIDMVIATCLDASTQSYRAVFNKAS